MAALETIKSGKHFTVYKNGDQKLIKIEGIRFSYPHFGVKRIDEDENGNKKESWGGVAMLPKATHVEAKDAFMALLTELQDNAPNDKGGKGVKIPSEYRCIKNGDDKEDEKMHGHWLITFNDSRMRPACRDQKGGLIVEETVIDDKFYGGCWGSVLLRPWYFNGQAKGKNKPYPKRLCCGFTGVQFLKDGEPFGMGRIDDTSAWGDESASSRDDDGL